MKGHPIQVVRSWFNILTFKKYETLVPPLGSGITSDPNGSSWSGANLRGKPMHTDFAAHRVSCSD
jgi:hypothetical protein